MATRKRPSLENMRNVSTFLSTPTAETISISDSLQIDAISLPLKQPRRYFDQNKLTQLVHSIREHGILEPLLVRPLLNGKYELVAGERRFRAAQEVGLSSVPVLVKELDDREALQISLIENLQREDLNPVEETEAILELLTFSLGVDKDEIISLLNRANHAKTRDQILEDNVILQLEKIESILSTIGKFTSESFRVNRLPLLKLPEEILETLYRGQIEYTKARAIARVKDKDQRNKLLEQAIEKEWSLSEIKQRISNLNTHKGSPNQDGLTLKEHFEDIYKRIRRANIWDDPKKRKKLDRLLINLSSLLEEGKD